MYRQIKVRENRRQLRWPHTEVDRIDLLWSLSAFLLLGLKSLWLYNILDPHTNSWHHISSNLLLICHTWTHLLAYHPHKLSWSHLQPATYTMHMITLPSNMPPTQFPLHFRQNICIQFTLGIRCMGSESFVLVL